MKLSDFILFINLYIYFVYFNLCYLAAIIFSGYSFLFIIKYYNSFEFLHCFAATFTCFLFYLAAEASSLMQEFVKEKIIQLKTLTQSK